MTSKLNLDSGAVLLARELARRAGEPVTQLALTHTTVSIERAVLRLGGLDGADAGGMPWANRLTDAVRASAGLEHGVALPAFAALLAGRYPDLRALAEAAAAGQVSFGVPVGRDAAAARELAVRSISAGVSTLDLQRERRAGLTDELADPPYPWVYLIVGSGDIDTDIPQAQAAARDGADVIAVIRSTGQSLLDYVPAGATREGHAGTYATQQNFRLMRAALDQTSRELGRYVRLSNYASGLCMPEIATLAGLEGLDMLLSDCLYGIIVRDLNPLRTFIDQRFCRVIGARAGIVVSPGEDNFLAPDALVPAAGAADPAPGVIASQLLNEYFGREAGLHTWQLGFGHGLEVNPAVPDSFLLELAQAQLVRELFPGAPLKYMPPTTALSGSMQAGCLLDAFFNLAGLMTDQSILCVGMMPEGIDLPFRADRDLALANIRYVRAAAGRLGLSFAPDPFVVERAHQVLDDAIALLRRISTEGLLTAVADGTFGVTRRPPGGGHGLDGVVTRADGYFNPVTEILGGADEGAAGDPVAELIGGDAE
ncbi:MAG TPA: lysine 5,6-aminomutase subunit alpha [Trebonia sp.]|jgi:beta-lysine 5,6-aminomutase alpha subunit|nr:lysine 5,6-aminomutase subunit alpha [Trebonia sp.]